MKRSECGSRAEERADKSACGLPAGSKSDASLDEEALSLWGQIHSIDLTPTLQDDIVIESERAPTATIASSQPRDCLQEKIDQQDGSVLSSLSLTLDNLRALQEESFLVALFQSNHTTSELYVALLLDIFMQNVRMITKDLESSINPHSRVAFAEIRSKVGQIRTDTYGISIDLRDYIIDLCVDSCVLFIWRMYSLMSFKQKAAVNSRMDFCWFHYGGNGSKNFVWIESSSRESILYEVPAICAIFLRDPKSRQDPFSCRELLRDIVTWIGNFAYTHLDSAFSGVAAKRCFVLKWVLEW